MQPEPQPTGNGPINSHEDPIVSLIRLFFALAILVITRIDPAEPGRFVVATYFILSIYAVYSLFLYLAVLRGRILSIRLQQSLHWIDAIFYVALVGLSSGTNSIFFILFFFCIIVASFRWGFQQGMEVTIVVVILYFLVGYAAQPAAPEFDLGRFLLRMSTLPILGYLIAYWGGYELRLRRRLALLKAISTLSNPRSGLNRTLADNLRRLRSFYDADLCLAVTTDSGDIRVHRSTRKNPEAADRPEAVSGELAETLLSFGEQESVCHGTRAHLRLFRRPFCLSKSGPDAGQERADAALCRSVAEILGASSFLTVPMRSHNRTAGRLFVADKRSGFQIAELDFLSQAMENIMPVLDNIVLVDKMASRAAEEERLRIARDIHDRIIQPYIGLQMGIASVRELCDQPGSEDLSALLRERTAKLQKLAGTAIVDLRAYVQRLKYGEGSDGGLIQGLKRYASRYFEATGIEMEVRAEKDFQINDRLAAEVFSMAAEAMSNIRRHTQAHYGFIELATAGDRLTVRIVNEKWGKAPPAPFVPKSIAERADTLNGTVRVETLPDGGTSVIIEIPL